MFPLYRLINNYLFNPGRDRSQDQDCQEAEEGKEEQIEEGKVGARLGAKPIFRPPPDILINICTSRLFHSVAFGANNETVVFFGGGRIRNSFYNLF